MKRISVAPSLEYIQPDPSKKSMNCSAILIKGSPKILIDGQMGSGKRGSRKTISLLEEEKPDKAFVSHYHLDHSFWGPLVAEHSKADLYIPRQEEGHLTDLECFLQKTAMDSGPNSPIDAWTHLLKDIIGYRELKDYGVYDGSLKLRSGGVTMQCIEAPGHSPGHMAFYFLEAKALFVVDIGIDRFGPWYGWPDADLCLMVESILRLRSLETNVILTSHSGILSSGLEEAWDGSLRALLTREREIREKLDKGTSRETIVDEGIYYKMRLPRSEPQRSFRMMWEGNIFDHHMALINNGSLAGSFPELRKIRI